MATDSGTSDRPPRDPLIVRSLEFLGGMAEAGGWRPPVELPEVAFAGRSNVGKSSLINRLLRRKKIARVSNTPGRTREINFFRVNDAFVLVDLPGYGYAKVSHSRRAEWRPLIETFLTGSTALRGVVQLLDVRRDPSDDDLQMLQYLSQSQLPTMVVLTKVDKIPPRELAARVATIGEQTGVPEDQMIPFSAVTGMGRDELAASLMELVAAPVSAPVEVPPAVAGDE